MAQDQPLYDLQAAQLGRLRAQLWRVGNRLPQQALRSGTSALSTLCSNAESGIARHSGRWDLVEGAMGLAAAALGLTAQAAHTLHQGVPAALPSAATCRRRSLRPKRIVAPLPLLACAGPAAAWPAAARADEARRLQVLSRRAMLSGLGGRRRAAAACSVWSATKRTGGRLAQQPLQGTAAQAARPAARSASRFISAVTRSPSSPRSKGWR